MQQGELKFCNLEAERRDNIKRPSLHLNSLNLVCDRTEAHVRKFTFVATACAFFLLAGMSFAQGLGPGGDVAIGFGSLISTPSASASGNYAPQSVGGGLYPAFSVNFLLRHHIGVNGELSWRGGQNLYEGQEPFRPIFYDFNALYSRRVGKKVGFEVMAGIGAENVRFYTGTESCNFITCTDYTSSTHFLGHVGGGIRYYVHGNFFIRPEVHLYMIQGNGTYFSSDTAVRAGASIGYSF